MNRKNFITLFLTIIGFISILGQVTAQEAVSDNVVRINVGSSYGSGAYIGDRLILSCAHIFSGENTVNTSVWFNDGTQYTGKAIKIDRIWDQSLIELNNKPNKIGIPIAYENPTPGESIKFYGYGRTNKLTPKTKYWIKN